MGWSWSGQLMYGILFNRDEIVDEEGCLELDWELSQKYKVDTHNTGEVGEDACLAIDESNFGASLGEFEMIRDSGLAIGPDWDDRLRKVCEEVGLEYSEPHWYIMCRMS